jgi:hypothetical protein
MPLIRPLADLGIQKIVGKGFLAFWGAIHQGQEKYSNS